jgi:hypothetical protein
VTFEVSHLDIFGNVVNDLQSQNILHILITFEVSQFDISSNDDNTLQPENINPILDTLEVSHFDILGNDFNESQQKNIEFISVILLIPFNFIVIGVLLSYSLSISLKIFS